METVDTPALQRVMIAVDGSSTSERALTFGATLAQRLGAGIGLVHVVDFSKGFTPEFGIADDRVINGLRVDGAELLRRAAVSLPAGIHVDQMEREGDPATQVVAAADEWGADMLVLGIHARGPVARFFLGSTAEGVVRRAHCPVVTVGHGPRRDQTTNNG